MISEYKVAVARKMLKSGVSGRRVARDLGISRGVVLRISTGKRPDYSEIRGRREDLLRPPFDESSVPVRCPTCGAKVHTPCLACSLKGSLSARLR